MPKKVSISWEDFGDIIEADYPPKDMDESISEWASQEAHDWVKEYEAENEVELSVETKQEIQDAIFYAIEEHWSPSKVFSYCVPIEDIVSSVNEWSKRGQQMAIYERALPSGLGITKWGETGKGLWFILAKPFLVAYAEAAFGAEGFGDEGMTLADMDGRSVAATIRRIGECEGRKYGLDLDRWDERRSKPSYWDLEKIVKKR